MRVNTFYPLTVFIDKPSKKPNYGKNYSHAGRPEYQIRINCLGYYRESIKEKPCIKHPPLKIEEENEQINFMNIYRQ